MRLHSAFIRGSLAASLAGAVLGAAACGGPSTTVVNARLDGRFVLEREPSRGTFAVTPLTRKADAQITALLGHPIVFAFDAALVPRWEEGLEYASEGAIDGVAQTLARMKEQSPDIFAWVAPRLRRVEWDYSATAQYTHHEFDEGKGTLRIVLVSSSERVVDAEQIGFAFGRAYAKTLGSRWASLDPASVSAGDAPAYTEWLLRYGYGHEHQTRPAVRGSDDETVDTPRARVVVRVLRFAWAIHGRDPAIEKKLRDWLYEHAAWLASTRRNHADAIARLGEGSDFRAAENGYVSWLHLSFDTLEERQKLGIVDELDTSTDRDGVLHAFAGFDMPGWYLHMLDLWVRAGKPKGELWQRTVGAVELPDTDDPGCGSTRAAAYRAMQHDDRFTLRVFDDVLRRKDPDLDKTFTANLLYLDGAPRLGMAFWRASEPDEAAFHATTRVLAGWVDRCNHSELVYDQLPRLWKAHPSRHVVLAYIISKYSTEGYRENFKRFFGELTRDDFVGLLDREEKDPLHELHSIWRDIGKGWSRMDVLEPRLDRWVTDDYKKRDMWWGISITSIAHDLCAEKDTKELARLHAWIERRIQARPSEVQNLREASEKSAPGACAP